MEIPTILCFLLSLPFWPALAPRGVNVSQWMNDLRYDWFMAESVIRSSCDVEGAEEHLPSYHSPGTTVLKDRNFQTKWMDSVNIRFFGARKNLEQFNTADFFFFLFALFFGPGYVRPEPGLRTYTMFPQNHTLIMKYHIPQSIRLLHGTLLKNTIGSAYVLWLSLDHHVH